jgi:hypothetical protein
VEGARKEWMEALCGTVWSAGRRCIDMVMKRADELSEVERCNWTWIWFPALAWKERKAAVY